MTRRDGVLHQTKRPKASAERAQADRRHEGQKGAWKNRESPSRKAGGGGKTTSSQLGTPPPGHSLMATALPKTQGREAVAGDQGRQGGNGKRKASLLGGVTRSRRASPRPARGLSSFISHASTPQAATSQLTQLAMEHSPNTLPISATSQEQRTPTRWRQYPLSPFPAYLLTTTHFRRRAHPAPQLASLPSRPGPARGGPRAGFRARRPGFLASVVPR